MKIRSLIKIVIQHLILYLVTFVFFYIAFSKPFAYYNLSSKVRHIILLGVVIIGFPLISVVWKIERRKAERKKQHDISKHESEVDH
jgi:hypothetical protein